MIALQDGYVEVRELLSDGRFRDIAVKRDFEARIRHAGVLGDTASSATSAIEAYIKQEDTEQMDTFRHQSKRDRFKVSPQVLILSLDTGDLLFIFVQERVDGTFQFVISNKAIPFGKPGGEDVGRHIAVDPRSRLPSNHAA